MHPTSSNTEEAGDLKLQNENFNTQMKKVIVLWQCLGKCWYALSKWWWGVKELQASPISSGGKIRKNIKKLCFLIKKWATGVTLWLGKMSSGMNSLWMNSKWFSHLEVIFSKDGESTGNIIWMVSFIIGRNKHLWTVHGSVQGFNRETRQLFTSLLLIRDSKSYILQVAFI